MLKEQTTFLLLLFLSIMTSAKSSLLLIWAGILSSLSVKRSRVTLIGSKTDRVVLLSEKKGQVYANGKS